MDCSTCHLGINNENYIICSCDNKYNYKCLYKENFMNTNWSNKSPPPLFSYLDHTMLYLNEIHV